MKPTTRYVLSSTGLVAFLLFWEGFARSGIMEPHLLPPPSTIPPALISEINEGFWQVMVWSSLRHYTIGFVLGSVLGVTLGVVVALFPKVEASQAYLARILRPIPPLAWIPFAIIWFGITETAAAFIISIGIFWINYFTAMGAVQAVDKDLIEVARAFGHRTFPALLRKVILPGAAPGILSGLRAGLGQGWMTVVAAELFGIQGIGQRMIEAAGLLNTQVVILYMFSIAFLYGVSDYIFVRIQQRILAWQR